MTLVSFPLPRAFRDFERLTSDLFASPAVAGPAYDLESKGEGAYTLTLAVPGYADDELDLAVEGRRLTVKGEPKAEEGKPGYVRKGIRHAPFTSTFALGEHVQVKDAKLERGLLRVELAREVPEAMKPRRIAINGEKAAA